MQVMTTYTSSLSEHVISFTDKIFTELHVHAWTHMFTIKINFILFTAIILSCYAVPHLQLMCHSSMCTNECMLSQQIVYCLSQSSLIKTAGIITGYAGGIILKSCKLHS